MIYIGIDDTDNLSSRGTGFLARELGMGLHRQGLIQLHSVTRHQLLKDDRIPFTSHNSAASITGTDPGDRDKILEFCEEFLYNECASGSDVGLCVADDVLIDEEVVLFGQSAKKVILTKEMAHDLALEKGIFLKGLTGKKIGVIGALAALGLRKPGNDGRLLWLENMREVTGSYTQEKYRELVPVEEITDMQGTRLAPGVVIDITDWCRPVMINGKITLVTENTELNGESTYRSASKDYIKSISE